MVPCPAMMTARQEITQDQAQGCANQPLHQALAHDQPDDRAPARADRPQHPDVVAPFGDDGAEGVEDDERAHEQRQEAEDVEGGLRHAQAREDLRAAGQRVEAVALAELRLDLIGDRLALRLVRRVQIGLDDVEPALHVEQLLRLRQRDQHLLAAGQGHAGTQAHDLEPDHALGGRDAEGVAELQPQLIGQALPDDRHVAVALLQEAPFGGRVIVHRRAGDRVDADQREAGHGRALPADRNRAAGSSAARSSRRPRAPHPRS